MEGLRKNGQAYDVRGMSELSRKTLDEYQVFKRKNAGDFFAAVDEKRWLSRPVLSQIQNAEFDTFPIASSSVVPRREFTAEDARWYFTRGLEDLK